MAEQFRLYLLGGFRLERISAPKMDGTRVHLYSRKVELLLAYLALFPQEHAREKIAALLWGDSTDEQARMSLRRALNDLRKQLGADAVLADRETVQLNPDFALWVDVQEIYDLRFMISDLNLEQIENQKSKIENYSELLPDFYDDWLEPPREELRGLFLDAALKLIDHARAQSEYKTAIDLAQKILTVDKANESAHQHLMFCFGALGDRAAALDQYEFCKRALREELGIEPSQETRALFETIRKQTETKSEAARLTNLPRPATSFIGRDKEIREITEMLRGERSKEREPGVPPPSALLTLLGPGGSGKTRLAIESGRALVPDFPDGVWWVDFSALQDETFVPNQVAKALGVPEQSNVPIMETLQEKLRTKHLLLVLDNCEHLTKGAARLVQALLATCPLSILATSRARLNVPGELVYQVSTLATPKRGDANLTPTELLAFEAVKLFTERVRLHQPTFHLNEQNAPHVVRICQRLDGIPLALELAAAQIQTFSLDEIAARLEQRRELADATRVHSRQQTLRALLDWSYDLLTPVEQVLFRRLGVFAGGWTLEQAIVVAGGYPSADTQWNIATENNEPSLPVSASFVVNALLHTLVSKSLVLVENERYHFLETIREYAREKLVPSTSEGLEATGERNALDKRHYAYFVQLAETAEPELRGKHQIEWGERLDTELPNLRAALDWVLLQPDANLALRLSGALHFFWMRGSYASEARDWYERALAKKNANSDPHYLARTYSGAGSMAYLQGDFVEASSLHTQALYYFELVDDKFGIAFSLNNIAVQAIHQGNLERAELLIDRALMTAREANNEWVTTNALLNSALIFDLKGNTPAAAQRYEESLALSQSIGNARIVRASLHNLGCIEIQRGNFRRAEVLLDEALYLAKVQRNNAGVMNTLMDQGWLFIREGEYAKAAEVCQHSAQLAVELSFKLALASAMEWLAAAVGYQRQFERAVHLWGAASALREEICSPIPPYCLADYEKALAFVREQIGEKRFAELLAEGHEMSMDQVQDLMFS